MVLLVLVPSPPYVAIQRRELLPRGFILTLSGGLFSVTAFIRLLPSALSAAGCPCQSGLSSAIAHPSMNVSRDRSVLPIFMFSEVQYPPFRGKMFYPIPKSLPKGRDLVVFRTPILSAIAHPSMNVSRDRSVLPICNRVCVQVCRSERQGVRLRDGGRV